MMDRDKFHKTYILQQISFNICVKVNFLIICILYELLFNVSSIHCILKQAFDYMTVLPHSSRVCLKGSLLYCSMLIMKAYTTI